jgi:hypothetical protein
MGKKFITLSNSSRKYKLFSEDIKKVHRKIVKTIPLIPKFEIKIRHYEDDTE